MAFVSVTRLRLRSWRFVPAFAIHAIPSNRQARAAPGFEGGSLLRDRRLTFWTLTVWADQAAMRAYMTSGAHRAAMPRLMDWCDEASIVHWLAPSAALPAWPEAEARMRGEGRPSKLRRPGPDHHGMTFAPPRLSAATRPAPTLR